MGLNVIFRFSWARAYARGWGVGEV